MRFARHALKCFMSVTTASMAIFTAIIMWRHGWHYSSNAILTGIMAIWFMWGADR